MVSLILWEVMSKMKVGFVGLGLMGLPMAKNLVKAGFELYVYNRTVSKAKELVEMGAHLVNSPKEVGENAEVIITIVTGPKDVEQVIFGQNGIVKGAHSGSIIVDMSTIGPQKAKQISSRLSKHDIKFVDAPVTGGTTGAKDGTLTIFVGGEEANFKTLLPIFEAMGNNNLYIGATGSGQAIKLVNNLIVGESLIALAEGFLLAEAQGLTRSQVGQFLENVPALSGMMKNRLPKMIASEYSVTFSVANMYKDLDLALKELKDELPLLKKSAQLYKKAIKKGWGELDNSSVIKAIVSKN